MTVRPLSAHTHTYTVHVYSNVHTPYVVLPPSLFSQMVLQNVDKAQLKLRMKKDNVAGVLKSFLLMQYIASE